MSRNSLLEIISLNRSETFWPMYKPYTSNSSLIKYNDALSFQKIKFGLNKLHQLNAKKQEKAILSAKTDQKAAIFISLQYSFSDISYELSLHNRQMKCAQSETHNKKKISIISNSPCTASNFSQVISSRSYLYLLQKGNCLCF